MTRPDKKIFLSYLGIIEIKSQRKI